MSGGFLRRRIRVATREGLARGVVEDDFHHFRVSVHATNAHVTSVTADAIRRPWTMCSQAADGLSDLVGMPLSTRPTAVLDQTDRFEQCTHMLDLAGLGVAALARGVATLQYDIAVSDRVDGRTKATLRRDGQDLLTWLLDGALIEAGEPGAGVNLRIGFREWVQTLPDDLAEAVLVLRRGVFISGGRGKDLDAVSHSAGGGGCFVQQPRRAPNALRMVGSTLDFSNRPDAPTASDGSWLAFHDLAEPHGEDASFPIGD